MKGSFNVIPVKFSTIHELPGAWSQGDFKALLEKMDMDTADIPDGDLKEMCQMTLTDLEPAEAAALVLEYRLGEPLSEGQIKNLANEMEEEAMWEEYPQMSAHEEIFNVNQLLHKAYNGKFPAPKAVALSVDIKGKNPSSENLLSEPTEALIARILMGGMDGHSVLIRLFEDQLKGGSFPEAPSVLWKINKKAGDDGAVQIEVIGSSYWLEDFKSAEPFTVQAWHDTVEEEVETVS